jgi:hypothetical protein
VSELAEITYTLGRLQAELEDLAVGGLRAAGPDRLPVLRAVQEDLARAGASHLAGRLQVLVDALRADQREAAAALVLTQASLRVFERVLTLETTAARLQSLVPAEPASGAVAEDGDVDEDGDVAEGDDA